jgi:PBP1b-binding outer membrane lipoprotein LpoB
MINWGPARGRKYKMMERLLFGLLLSLLLLGCESAEFSDAQKMEGPLVWDEIQTSNFEPRKQSSLVMVAAPEQGANISVISGFDDPKLLSPMISQKIERMWTDEKTIYLIVSLKNDTDKGTRATFYAFGYDEMGRVVSTNRSEIFFKPNESVFQEYKYPRSGREAHWSFSVK